MFMSIIIPLTLTLLRLYLEGHLNDTSKQGSTS